MADALVPVVEAEVTTSMYILGRRPLAEVVAAMQAAENALLSEGADLSVRGRGGRVPPRVCLGAEYGIGASRVAALARQTRSVVRLYSGGTRGCSHRRYYWPRSVVERAAQRLTDQEEREERLAAFGRRIQEDQERLSAALGAYKTALQRAVQQAWPPPNGEQGETPPPRNQTVLVWYGRLGDEAEDYLLWDDKEGEVDRG